MRTPLCASAAMAAALRISRRPVLATIGASAGLALGLGPAGLLGRLPAALAETGTEGESAAAAADWDVPGGHFYTQAAPAEAPADSGYVVSDADGLRFWRDYRQLGGPAQLGYPISARYESGGAVYQAMQAGLLRWNPDAAQAEAFPIFAALAAQNLDGWLEGQGVPRTAARLLEDPELPASARLAWLTHPALRAAYLNEGEDEAIQRYGLPRYGLPMGEPQRFGPYLAQRFDKAVLQLWLDSVPGQPAPGAVSLVQVGDLLKAADLIPETALEPVPPPAPRPAAPAQPRPASTVAAAPPAPVAEGKLVVVSLSRQWWYAYQDGQTLYRGPVTTGRPELSTPAGRFTVLSRHSPYVFVSPWPRGSPFWYETSPCSFALRITGNGVFLHDAPWRPYYGPGTNVPHRDPDGVWRTGSHGCINMPYQAALWLWGWAPAGTPVDVTF